MVFFVWKKELGSWGKHVVLLCDLVEVTLLFWFSIFFCTQQVYQTKSSLRLLCLPYSVSIIIGGENLKIVPKIFLAFRLNNILPNHANRDEISSMQLNFGFVKTRQSKISLSYHARQSWSVMWISQVINNWRWNTPFHCGGIILTKLQSSSPFAGTSWILECLLVLWRMEKSKLSYRSNNN